MTSMTFVAMERSRDFTTLVESLVQLLIADHKLSQLVEPGNSLPAFCDTAEKYLISLIQPFCPTEKTYLQIRANARDWSTAQVASLREHYSDLKDKNTQTIQSLVVPDWKQALKIATRKAKKHTSSLSKTSIETTSNLVTNLMTASVPKVAALTEQNPQPNNSPPKPTPAKIATPNTPPKPIPTPATYLKPARQEPLFTSHPHYGDKYRNWSLTPNRPILLVGDSNLSRLPSIFDNQVQVDSFPGAKIAHAAHIIASKTPASASVTKVILSFGINDKERSNPSFLKEQLGDLHRAATRKFPNASIRMALINHSSYLSPQIQNNIAQINDLIKSHCSFIPCVPKTLFQTTRDNVHWTPNTAQNILNHWKTFRG